VRCRQRDVALGLGYQFSLVEAWSIANSLRVAMKIQTGLSANAFQMEVVFKKIDEQQILNSTNKLNHRPMKRTWIQNTC
jgi:hypothetical protein